MKRIKWLKRATAAVLCMVMVLTNAPFPPLPVKAADETLYDGTVVKTNDNGSKTAIIQVTPEQIELQNQQNQEERLIQDGACLTNEGDMVDTQIQLNYKEGEELVKIAQDGTSISFQPIAEESSEEETGPDSDAETGKETEPVSEAETESETSVPETESETAESEPEEASESETEAITEAATEKVTETEAVTEPASEPDTEVVEETEADIFTPISHTRKNSVTQMSAETGKTDILVPDMKLPELNEEDLIAREDSDPHTDAEELSGSEEAEQSEELIVEGQKEDDQAGTYGGVTYEGLFNEVTDVRLSALKGGIKEDIIIKEYKEQLGFVYAFTFEGLVPELSGQQVFLRDSGGAVKAVIEAPFMVDANGQYSEAIEVGLRLGDDGGYILTYQPDDSWLRAKGRAYPVTVDPTVTYNSDSPLHMEDNYVTAESPNTNNYFNETYFKVGNDSAGTHMAYIRPVIPDSLKAKGSKILIKDASINMYEYSGNSSSQNFSLHLVTGKEWSSRDITYNNAPKFSARAYQTKQIKGSGWVKWDLKEMFSAWFNVFDQKANYGFALVADKGTSGDYRYFYLESR